MKNLAVVLLVVLAGGCGSSTPASSTSSEGPSPDATSLPNATSACAEVRAGIDAFNQGDFGSTVAHFRSAVPLAEAEAKRKASSSADQLVAAVRYYADLAPSDYPQASRSSSDFARYKQITLVQCESGQESPESPGQQA